MLNDLKNCLKAVGKRQCLKAVEENKVKQLFIAKDADRHIVEEIEGISEKRGIEIVYVDSRKQLGKACGIEVSAAVACTLIA